MQCNRVMFGSFVKPKYLFQIILDIAGGRHRVTSDSIGPMGDECSCAIIH